MRGYKVYIRSRCDPDEKYFSGCVKRPVFRSGVNHRGLELFLRARHGQTVGAGYPNRTQATLDWTTHSLHDDRYVRQEKGNT